MANIMLIEEGIARIVRSFGYTEHGLARYEQMISKLKISAKKTPIIHQIMKSKQAVIVPDLTLFAEQKGFDGMGLSGSVVSTPILIGGSVIGLINLNSLKQNSFTTLDAGNMQIFANQAAVAIHNARLFNQAQETAMLKERQRLARDLHDAVSQSLFAASSITESLAMKWDRKPDEALRLVRDLEYLIKSIRAEMRVLLWELRPENLVTTPLDKLLVQLIDSVQARTKIIIHHKVQEIPQLPEHVHITLYRITQEALNNIIKHSRASEGNVELSLQAHQTVLHIRDNGRGFSLSDTSSGFGLGNMHERAQSIKASLDVMSQPGAGTEITVRWEYPPAAKT
jgi:two-component system nitrate/nitrite sensor histidine kinase NarX